MTHAVGPSPERRQHNRVHRVVVVDTVGNRAIPWQAMGLLAILERRGDISAAQRQAGEQFHRLFQRAALDPLRAADMGRVGGCSASHDAHGSEHAKRQVSKAMLALGGAASPQGSCAWVVLGCDQSLAQWAIRMNWRSQAMNDQMAKGMLVVTLDTLARYWGLTGA
jgi:hypothetical protein